MKDQGRVQTKHQEPSTKHQEPQVPDDQPTFSCFTLRMASNPPHALHRHPFHEIYYSLAGQGQQYTATRTMEANTGDLFFFPAGQDHSARGLPGQEHLATVVYLPQNFFGRSLPGDGEALHILQIMQKEAEQGRNRIRTGPEGQSCLRQTFGELMDESERRAKGFRAMQKSLVQKLLVAVLRHGNLPLQATVVFEGKDAVGRVQEFRQFLDHNYHQQIDVERATAMTGLSRSHFHAVFRRLTGGTLVQYLQERRTDEVVRLLTTTDKSLADVADACGFTSISHLYNVLRKRTGLCPALLRTGR